jgi:transposase-like protein
MGGKTRPPYTPEYRKRILDLVRAGRSPATLAREFEPTEMSIRNWMKQEALDNGHRKDGLTTDEREELARLRREVKVLREERDILKKAATWFAQESNTGPSKRSSS